MRNLTHSYKPSYWTFVTSFKYVAHAVGKFLLKNRLPENTNWPEVEEVSLECTVKASNRI